MAVTSEDNKATYAGDGATTSFSTVFTFSADDEVNVVLVTDSTGAEVSWTDGTQYTLTGAGTGVAGTLTVDTSPTDYTPASGETLVIELLPAFTQPDALPRGGTVSPKGELEPMFDRLLRQILRIKDQVDLSVKASSAETSIGALPNVANRKGYLLGFNATTGAPEVSTMTTANIESGATDAASSATDADTAKTAAEAAQTAAEAAQTAAETAETNAETAETNAETAEANAEAVATGLSFTFAASTAMADPGTGTFRMNNATVSSVTALAFDATSAETGNPDVSDWIAAWDDISNAVGGGILTLKKAGTPATYAIFYVTAVTDNTGWLQTAVTHIDSNGAWSASDRGFAQFAPSGADGAGTVTPSSTDTFTNKTIDANGTGNSISNIDVEDLANGTDGELITWDAAGAPAVVGAGTAAQVLTSNGAGAAPTFQDAAGGGWEWQSTLSVTAVADLDFTGLDSTKEHQFVLEGMNPGTNNVAVQIVLYESAAWNTGSNYPYEFVSQNGDGQNNSGSSFPICDSVHDNSNGKNVCGIVTLGGFAAGEFPLINSAMSFKLQTAGTRIGRHLDGIFEVSNAVTGVRFTVSSGAWDALGSIKHYARAAS